jgi:hypothetical protein
MRNHTFDPRRLGIVVLGIVACSTPPSPPSPDAPMETEEGRFGVGCEGHTTPVTTYTMPQSEVGQTVAVRLEVPPHDGAITFSVEGPDAAAFSIEQEASGRTNLVFVSTEARAYSATVVASANSTLLAQLSVTANVVPAAGPLRFSSPLVELGLDRSDSRSIILKNHSTSTPVDIDPALVTSDDGDLADLDVSSAPPSCPATLGPGESCTIYVNRHPGALGCRRNQITIHGSTNTVVADVAISVGTDVRMFAANGTISTNAGPSCTGECVVRLLDGPVVATATPAPGFRFIGWSADSGCAAEPTCTLAFPTAYLQALFAPAFSPRTTITFAGPGHGYVLVSIGGATVRCDRTCTVSAPNPESPIVLDAATMSPFGGWSGACNTTGPECNLGTPQHDQAVTVTFGKDAQEVATVSVPGVSPNRQYTGAFLSNGDIIIGAESTISRVAMDGTVRWSRPASVLDVVVTPNDTIIYLSYKNTPAVFALDPAGDRLWMRPLATDTWYGGPSGHFLAVTSAGDVAVLVNGVATMFSAATGGATWRKSVPYGAAIAADHAGVIAIATAEGSSLVAHRYTLAGDEILPAWPIGTVSARVTMAFDSDNALVVSRRGLSGSTLRRYDATGVLVFETTAIGSMAVAGTQIVQVGYGTGLDVDMTITSSAGAPVSTLTKRPTYWSLSLSGLASDGLGRVAILGSEGTSSFSLGFAEILQIPP